MIIGYVKKRDMLRKRGTQVAVNSHTRRNYRSVCETKLAQSKIINIIASKLEIYALFRLTILATGEASWHSVVRLTHPVG